MTNGRRRLNLLAPPDLTALEVGAGGERFVARTRLAFFAVIWIIPAALLVADTRPEMPVSFVAASIAVVVSGLFVYALRRDWNVRWMPFLTSAFDVTIVSATLAAFALIGRPHLAVNSMVVWEIYLLAVMATALRFDVRVCLFSGGLAIVQYAAILVWVTTNWNVREPDALHFFGRLSWSVQIARLFLMVATMVVAIAFVMRSRRFVDLSGTDTLTGLSNRTYFGERLRNEMTRARRSGRALAVAMIDLDKFKMLNDEWGHDVGDEALQLVAGVFRSETRPSDLIARWGGEEFIIVFPDTDLAGASLFLDGMRAALAARPLPRTSGKVRITFSAGVAQHPLDGAVDDELIASADRRLLRAKALGRDRVVSDDAA